MSLLYYERKFGNLNPNRSRGEASPHKVAMLLAVMELMARGEITGNRIYFSESLKNEFAVQLDRLKNEGDRNNPHLPFFHLRSSGFWHHEIKPGMLNLYGRLSTASGPGVIDEHIAYAYLDDELFEILSNSVVREYLKTPLFSNLEITDELRGEKLEPDHGGWNWLESEACVQSYLEMLAKELKGEKYSKAENRRALQKKLNDRSEGSVEFKHQNISAVLVEMGFPYISGYKPAFNYQRQLRDVVLAHLAAEQNELDSIDNSDVEYARQEEILVDWDDVMDNELPERIPVVERPERTFLARRTNFTEREARNKILGMDGEEFVAEYEKHRLSMSGREDLAREVEWSSKERGDGLGYDIRSFQIRDGQVLDEEHYIEVKTTKSGRFQPFFITDNEVAFSRQHASRYSLYRVYDFRRESRIFALGGAIDRQVRLTPTVFKASLEE